MDKLEINLNAKFHFYDGSSVGDIFLMNNDYIVPITDFCKGSTIHLLNFMIS